jgi:hypothetical protein
MARVAKDMAAGNDVKETTTCWDNSEFIFFLQNFDFYSLGEYDKGSALSLNNSHNTKEIIAVQQTFQLPKKTKKAEMVLLIHDKNSQMPHK